MKSVRDIPMLHTIPVLVRGSLNVPLVGGTVENEYRLRRALPTLQLLQKGGARVVIISHLGEKGTETLEPVAKALGRLIAHVSFCHETIGPKARGAIRDMDPGDILVLENLRRSAAEVANDPAFAKELALLADVFVQDSFDTCHRMHASMVGVPKLLPSYAGLTVEEEVHELTKALKPASPSLAIIGGAKFSTKEPVLKVLLERYDKVFVGGALANDFLKAKGYGTGASLLSDSPSEMFTPLLSNTKLLLPIDGQLGKRDGSRRVGNVNDIKGDEALLDAGPGTTALLAALAEKAKTVLWNGPLGKYEDGYIETTDALAKVITGSGAYSVIGGGDTIAEIERVGLLDQFSFVSTGGGAMLDFLAKGTLPGIAALG